MTMSHLSRRALPMALLATASTVALGQTGSTTTPNRAARAPVAAPWPTAPVRLLIGFPPGSVQDLSARAIAEALSKSLGQPVVVENKAGASGTIAADQVAKATDRHTLAS